MLERRFDIGTSTLVLSFQGKTSGFISIYTNAAASRLIFLRLASPNTAIGPRHEPERTKADNKFDSQPFDAVTPYLPGSLGKSLVDNNT